MQRDMYERHAAHQARVVPADEPVSRRDAFIISELQKARPQDPEAGFRVVELSVGEGELTRAILRELAGVDLLACDISSTRIDSLRRSIAELPGLQGSATFAECNLDEPFGGDAPGTARVVVAMDIMEHVFDVFHFVANIAELLQMGGRLILRVPNIAYARRRAELLRGVLPVTSSWFGPAGDYGAWRERYGWDGSHLHYFTDDSLTQLLGQYGLTVRWRGDPGTRFEDLRRLAPGLLCGNLMVVAEKTSSTPPAAMDAHGR